MEYDGDPPEQIEGTVKWFDPKKGFGFVIPELGGSDILLHANVLRNFGQSSVADGSRISLTIQKTPRGVQAVQVIAITPPSGEVLEPFADLPEEVRDPSIDDAPFVPARVKWFDKSKGFGFANIFGKADDIFIHVEVLRRSGLADLQPGEAVALKIVDGSRGLMAARVATWDVAQKDAF